MELLRSNMKCVGKIYKFYYCTNVSYKGIAHSLKKVEVISLSSVTVAHWNCMALEVCVGDDSKAADVVPRLFYSQ